MRRLLMGVTAAAALLVAAWAVFHPSPGSAVGAAGQPRLEFQPVHEFGEREEGEEVEAICHFANRGDGPLRMDGFRMSCSCAGFERIVNGQRTLVEVVELGPGQQTSLHLRLRVRGPLGLALRQRVDFHTNDPRLPLGHVEIHVAKINGGTVIVPTAVMFGTLALGQRASGSVEVRDQAVARREIERVEPADPRVQVRVEPLPAEQVAVPKSPSEWRVARLALTVDSSTIGDFQTSVRVYLKGRARPDEFLVSGRIVAAAEFHPATLTLPRNSSQGLVHEATCECRGTEGRPMELELLSAPKELSVRLARAEGEACWRIQVRLDPAAPANHKWLVKFKVKAAAESSVVELPVYSR